MLALLNDLKEELKKVEDEIAAEVAKDRAAVVASVKSLEGFGPIHALLEAWEELKKAIAFVEHFLGLEQEPDDIGTGNGTPSDSPAPSEPK